ncbi:dienelactone hydrolase family protein [Saccharopolyspora hirsuta]|uniref:Alpha/beta hydrolase n=1 Tax=Saccharopolyspora hirsuta TaxID=1837 RepID=A0A5M7BZ21_SACHI|nr:dienelactone hydrolase family protein [Saccharopolyspora hirsuta]KAA5833477.1 alpha/beta hydrolase [Saccharopolyspora hirsuta]MBF6507839.1 dienelactone hydrolase family protein [Nocardia farcinica]
MARTAKKAPSAKNAFEELSRRGPHDVLHGDLALVGLPGIVCTPRSGLGLPAIAFGHGWLQPPRRYLGLLRHLASWGFVVAAPATQRGVFASHRMFATDLRTALDVAVGVRLGEGEISVDEKKLGVAGHAMGGGCAVLAAAEDERIRAVATLAAAETRPSALEAAARVKVPGLHIAAGNDLLTPAVANAEPIARAWGGAVQLRTVPKASHLGFTEGRHWTQLVLHGKSEYATQRATKALLTAYFLSTLTGDRRGEALLTTDIKGTQIDQTHTRGTLTAA